MALISEKELPYSKIHLIVLVAVFSEPSRSVALDKEFFPLLPWGEWQSRKVKFSKFIVSWMFKWRWLVNSRSNLSQSLSFKNPSPFSVQFSSVVQPCPTLCDPMNRSTPGLPVHHHSRSSLRLRSIESVMSSSHLVLCHPLFLLPPIPPSVRVFSNESTLRMRWPKYWSFSLSIIPSKEISGLISFKMDWLDLLAVQGTLKSLLQHHSSKASILWRSAFFTVQLSHPHMTSLKARKNHSLD